MTRMLELIGAAIVLVAVVRSAWRCRHPGPLGLLPPRVEEDGARLPARWYCPACSHTWPAGLERTTTPVVRFSGHDESKAPAAARAADKLARERQAREVLRSGVKPARRKKPDNVRDFRDRRRA